MAELGVLLTSNATKAKEWVIYIKTFNLKEESGLKIYTDQTGKFPVRSYRENQYIMVIVKMDRNIVLTELVKKRTSGGLVRFYQNLVINSSRITPKLHILDNECSDDFKIAMKNNGMLYQLVSPCDNRWNITELAIQTFKLHFVLVLCGTGKKFPM